MKKKRHSQRKICTLANLLLFLISVNKKRPLTSHGSQQSSFVHPMRIELISSEPESGILSIELRVHP